MSNGKLGMTNNNGKNPKKKRRSVVMLTRSHPHYRQLARQGTPLPDPNGKVASLRGERILVSPVNLTGRNLTVKGAYARYDYNKEMMLMNNGRDAQWDQPSTRKDQARVGDLFAFTMTAGVMDKMELFRITKLLPANERREHWVIDDHSERGVVVLSKYIGWVSSSTFASLVDRVPVSPVTGKMFVANGTQVYPWREDIEVFVSCEEEEYETFGIINA